MLTHLDLFSGIGGFALAAEWAGFKTIGFVEIDKYCQKVLRKRFPNVPIVEDIRDVGKIKEIVANAKNRQQPQLATSNNRCEGQRQTQKRPVIGASGRSGDGDIARRVRDNHRTPPAIQVSGEHSPITLITGGFPCQPFSVAGKRRGTADNRYLWNEMLTVIKAIKPTWVLAENVAGIAGMEFTDSVSGLEGKALEEVEAELSAVLDRVCADLEEIGYKVQPIIIPACAVNAPHRRDRAWIVAHASRTRCDEKQYQVGIIKQEVSEASTGKSGRTVGEHGAEEPKKEDVGNTLSNGYKGGYKETKREKREGKRRGVCQLEGTSDVVIPKSRESREQTEQEGREDTGRGSQEVIIADTKGNRIQGGESISNKASCGDWWAVEPELGRVAHGIPDRVDRLKCLGNAIVPQVAYQILKAIVEIENGQG